ncbi:hypothetical protein [Lentisalinibacter orientalis]|uniref:hypothetical protein n=1 Tax=Lentisalinibacter orientalis TaxID=2992241 RepID=UPI003863B000
MASGVSGSDPGAGETGLLGTRYLGYDAPGRRTAKEQDQANGTVLATSYTYQGLKTTIEVNNASLLMHRIYNCVASLWQEFKLPEFTFPRIFSL